MKLQSVLFKFIVLLYFFPGYQTHAQSLPIPLNYEQAYGKGTRSMNGTPGPAYWQNNATYEIDVEFNPATQLLYGKEDIVYTNHSPDTLHELLFHLYPNLYKSGVPRDYDAESADLHNGMNIKTVIINNKELPFDPSYRKMFIYNTLLAIHPDQPVLPGDSVQIGITWDYPVNKGSHLRTGRVDTSSWFIAYFYPRLCVYDDIDGWDYSQYTGEKEFYHDFADYTLNVTVPGDFLVWATGHLRNPEQLLSDEYLERFRQSIRSDEIIPIVAKEDLKKQITTRGKVHTWEFKAVYVTDVAFAFSDHYLMDATSLVVDTVTGRRTWIAAAYDEDSQDFYKVCRIARSAVEQMSFHYPAWPFPFPSVTVFNGLSEMEYPMMVNDISVGNDDQELYVLTIHELLHAYFPFFMGTNETENAWMDEGLTTMGEYLLTSVIDTIHESVVMYADIYNATAGDDYDLPLFSNSNCITGYPYWQGSYTKAAFFYLILRDYLGEKGYLEAMHAFMERWNGKHPTPFDFFFTFSDVSGEDLSWLIRPWFFEFGYPDLGIETVETIGERVNITIKKNGLFPVPVHLTVQFSDSTAEIIHEDAGIWKNGNEVYEITFQSSKTIERVELGHKEIPDADSGNNAWAKK
jgi:hypothetical protein